MVFNQANAVNFLFSHNSFILVSVFIFLAGLSIGSFLNVVIYRLPEKLSIVYPPSACPGCSSKIKFYDNIPVLSYIILRGRCRKCGEKISPLYPMVELLTGVLFYLLFLKYFYASYFFYKINAFDFDFFRGYLYFNLIYLISGFIFLSVIIPVIFIDLFHRIIPDSLNIFLIVSGFLINIFAVGRPFWFPLTGSLVPGLFFYLIAVFYQATRKKEGLGGGDIKLIAGIGAFLGLGGALFSIFGGSVLALAGFAAFAAFKKLAKADVPDMDFRIPFGPFLSAAAVIYIFYGDFLSKIYLNLMGYR